MFFLPICLLNQSDEYADLLWPFFCKHEDLPPRENVQIRQIDGQPKMFTFPALYSLEMDMQTLNVEQLVFMFNFMET